MSYYYHVHKGNEPSTLETFYDKNQPSYWSQKGSFWNIVEKDMGINYYGGYREYRLHIPEELFTESLYSYRKHPKIYRVTHNNVKEYRKLRRDFPGHIKFNKEMIRRGFTGIDATIILPPSYRYYHSSEFILFHTNDWEPEMELVDIVVANPKF